MRHGPAGIQRDETSILSHPAYLSRMNSPPLAPDKPCPICGKPAMEKFRPFCSGRCADVDLNRWLSGLYAIPVRETDDDPEQPRTRDRDGED
jgi:endogenous inhibitor of DNA gyrase (YacG/DUF329 family)